MAGTGPWVAQANVEPIAAVTVQALANSALYNVVSGCGGTYSGAAMTLTIAAGSVTHNGTTTTVAGNDVTLVADPSNPRWTYTYINSSGTAVVVSGSAAATPAVPDPGANVTAQLTYVQAALTIATNATYKLDKRVMVAVVAPAGAAIYGSNTTEATATSAAASDYVTISSLSIPAGKPFRVKCMYRKTTGAATAMGIGLKVNSTVVREAAVTAGVPRTSAANEAESGMVIFEVYPGETGYLASVIWIFDSYDASGGQVTSSLLDAAATNGPASLSAVLPAATVTSIAIRGIGSASMTTAIKNVFVEAI